MSDEERDKIRFTLEPIDERGNTARLWTRSEYPASGGARLSPRRSGGCEGDAFARAKY